MKRVDKSAVNELLAPTQLKGLKPVKALPAPTNRLLEAAATISLEPDAVELAFMARELVQCTLPHSDPGDVPIWTRTNGNLALGIQPGYDLTSGVSIGYPYGSIPRLLLFWITTEAVQTKNRRIVMGRSLDEFIRAVGLNPNTGGGRRGDARRLHTQMDRLFAAKISFQQVTEQGKRWRDMQIAPEGELWWDTRRPQQTAIWESWIEIGEKFYEAITAAPVPVDLRALRALKQSPLALDLYAWATHKSFVAGRKGKGQFVPWQSLATQFGANYKTTRDFKLRAVAALRKIEAVYPKLRLQDASGGLLVLPDSKPSVSRVLL